MASVTKRISEIKQPRGGYVKLSEFDSIVIDDCAVLYAKENLSGNIVGSVVDYLTRYIWGTDKKDAFRISLEGAELAEKFGIEKATSIAEKLLNGINDLDDISIINACELVAAFDVWKRNPIAAMRPSGNIEIIPDMDTISNIRTLLMRCNTFWGEYGPIIKDGFNFGPTMPDRDAYLKMITGNGTYGGYTPTVNSGDGDFLTADTLWDFKVLRFKPASKDTLQLLMYWIMGQHSGQDIFKNITKLGIFNPRLNTVYLKEVSQIPEEIIKTVEKDVICY